jgi:aryl-alcohol dehydrogenase-like predicted oxidoreductase
MIDWLDGKVSVLGFGCAYLMGRYGRRVSLSALHSAMDAGINYFDVARSYGYGRAERMLGEFLKGRRDQCFVATKFGIVPPAESFVRSVARPIVRQGIRVAKWTGLSFVDRVLRKGIAHGTGGGVRREAFTPELARSSLETSLRELQTDFVDVLWLHECGPDDLTDELLRTLDRFVSEGKIRHYGPATNADSCAQILKKHPQIRMAQFPHHILNEWPTVNSQATVIHSVFGSAEARECLRNAARTIDPDILALKYALAANRSGVVVVGMYNPKHIAANAEQASALPDESTIALAASIRSKLDA